MMVQQQYATPKLYCLPVGHGSYCCCTCGLLSWPGRTVLRKVTCCNFQTASRTRVDHHARSSGGQSDDASRVPSISRGPSKPSGEVTSPAKTTEVPLPTPELAGSLPRFSRGGSSYTEQVHSMCEGSYMPGACLNLPINTFGVGMVDAMQSSGFGHQSPVCSAIHYRHFPSLPAIAAVCFPTACSSSASVGPPMHQPATEPG